MFITIKIPRLSETSPFLKALQKHYKNLEALALDRDEPEDVTDHTGKQLFVSSTCKG